MTFDVALWKKFHNKIVALVILLLGLSFPQDFVAAQISDSDITALQERGKNEGWTFTVGQNAATQRASAVLCGAIAPPDWRTQGRFVEFAGKAELPSSFDWRDFGGTPPVRDQGQCGSCWAHGTCGALECNIALADGTFVDLSEQWLLDCNRDGWDCIGGWAAFDYFTTKTDSCGGTGAVLEDACPYQAAVMSCGCPYTHPYDIESWAYILGQFDVPAVSSIKQAIWEYGPVFACVYAGDAFKAYTGGIFNADEAPGDDINHAVVLVGWDDAQGVWILRNSWGANWGEEGYMRITYGTSLIGYGAAYVLYPGLNRPQCGGMPSPPELISPPDGATQISFFPMLDWEDVSEAAGYDLFVWKSSGTRPEKPTAHFLRRSEYRVEAELEHNAEYHWQVVARNLCNSQEGPEWTFSTAPGLTITTEILPNAGLGDPFSVQLEAAGPMPPFEWRVFESYQWSLQNISTSGTFPLDYAYGGECAYLPGQDAVFMFGGCIEDLWNSQYTAKNWFYRLDVNSWQWSSISSSSVPTGRIQHCLMADTANNCLYLYGGASCYIWTDPYNGYKYPATKTLTTADSVRKYSPGSNSWSTLSTTGTGPGDRDSTAGVYVPLANSLCIDGGYWCDSEYYCTYSDTFLLNLTTRQWTRVSDTGQVPPGSRYGHPYWQLDDGMGIRVNSQIYALNAGTSRWDNAVALPSIVSQCAGVTGSGGHMYFLQNGSPVYEFDRESGLMRVMNGGTVLNSSFKQVLYLEDRSQLLLITPPSAKTLILTPLSVPPGLSLDANGVLSGVPTQMGEYDFTVCAVKSEGGIIQAQASRDFHLRVGQPLPGEPDSYSPGDGEAGVKCDIPLDWSDCLHAETYDLFLWKASEAKPAIASVKDLSSSAYVPASPLMFSTEYKWQVVAKNETGGRSGPEWSFTVKENDPPILEEIGNKIVAEGALLEFTVRAFDIDTSRFIYSAEAIPAGAVLDSVSGVFSWTPGYTASGQYPIVFSVSDGAEPPLYDTENVTITVTDTNQAPVFDPVPDAKITEGQSFQLNVSAKDPDGNHVVLAAENMPAGASFDPGTGIFSWTPSYASSGDHSVVLSATDDGSPPQVGFIEIAIQVVNVTHRLSGTVRAYGWGVPFVVLSGLPGDPVTDSNGYFECVVDHGWSGSAAPVLDGYGFQPDAETIMNFSSTRVLDFDAFPVSITYVDQGSVSGGRNGLSWATAFSTIQEGIDACQARGGGEVWVADGIYTSNLSAVVSMKSGVFVFGGFGGGELSRAYRSLKEHVCEVSGGNARRCVTGSERSLVDGVKFRSGFASSGGGMFVDTCSPIVRNCIFSNNVAEGPTGSDNFSGPGGSGGRGGDAFGGGIYCAGGNPIFINCVLSGNIARGGRGGYGDYFSGGYVWEGFGGSGGNGYGGAFYNTLQGSICLINCTLYGNTAVGGLGGYSMWHPGSVGQGYGGGVINRDSRSSVINCILWGNSGEQVRNELSGTCSCSYSVVQGGFAGTGNLDSDPQFSGTGNLALMIGPDSPCVDSGTEEFSPPSDLLGVWRPVGVCVDIGAYEWVPVITISGVVREQESPLEGVELLGFPETILTDTDGLYSTVVEYGWQGVVVPMKPGYTFVPDSVEYNTAVVSSQVQDYQAQAIIEGEGELPVEGEGEVLPEGEGEILPEGEGEGEPLPEGEGEVLPEGEGEVFPEGEGELPVEGEGEVLPEGEGEVLPEGEGEVLPEGEGEVLPEGEGEGEIVYGSCVGHCNPSDPVPIVLPGDPQCYCDAACATFGDCCHDAMIACPGNFVEGEGEILPEGEGEILPEGEGEVLPEGEGEVLPEGEGEVLPEGEGEVLPEGEGEDTCSPDVTPPVLKCADMVLELDASGLASFLTTAAICSSTAVTELYDNCEGMYLENPAGFTVTAVPDTFGCADVGVRAIILVATDSAGNEAQCILNATVRDVFGACIEPEGEGEVLPEGEGEILPEGEGEVVPEGEGEILAEGEGETLLEGEGEILPEGEGEVLPEGEGEILPEGEGVPEGEGEILPEGEGEALPEGEGETHAEGEVLSMLSVVPSSQNIDWVGGTATFSVRTTASWTAVSDASWAILNTSGGIGSCTLAVYCLDNQDLYRTATITIMSAGANPRRVTVYVNQSSRTVEGEEYLIEGETYIEGEGEGGYHPFGCCNPPSKSLDTLFGDLLLFGLALMALGILNSRTKG